MSRSGWGWLTAALVAAIVAVLIWGWSGLPRAVRQEISREQQQYEQAEQRVKTAQGELRGQLRAEPVLFRIQSLETKLPQQIDGAQRRLLSAGNDLARLKALDRANRKGDAAEAQRLLQNERTARTAAVTEADAAVATARQWVERKRNLPTTVATMQKDYAALKSPDLGDLTTLVQKAESDWPEKRTDLQSRWQAVTSVSGTAEQLWQQTAAVRTEAAQGKADLDYVTLLTAADTLHANATMLPTRVTELKSLTNQLYQAYDKVLVDLDAKPVTREKLKVVKTAFTDGAGKPGQTTTAENWVDVSPTVFQRDENHLGMTVEHKPAGKYDSEAERIAQPPGYAYVAPPGQSNQYGRWERHDNGSSVWAWLPQYLILSQLLNGRNYQPFSTNDYYGYNTARQSGKTYYGVDSTTKAPQYGTHGTFTQSRYASSRYMTSGTYKDSKYATSGGTYGGSRYSSGGSTSRRDSPSFGGSTNSSGGTRFGRSGSSSRGGFGGGMPRSMPSGGGRRFGGRR